MNLVMNAALGAGGDPEPSRGRGPGDRQGGPWGQPQAHTLAIIYTSYMLFLQVKGGRGGKKIEELFNGIDSRQ